MNYRKPFLPLLFIALFAYAVLAQSSPPPRPTTVYVVNYMKAKEGAAKNEHEVWLPLQREVVKAGNLAMWSVWEVLWAGKNSEYDYLTVDAYKNWAAVEKSPYTPELFAKAHPGKNPEELLKQTGEARDLVRSDVLAVMAQTIAPPNAAPAKYVLVEFWHVAPEKIPEYEKLLLETYYPWRQEGVTQGRFSFWQFYYVLGAGSESPYNYITARGYDKWENIGSVGGPELLAKVHPNLKPEDLNRRTEPLRTLVKTHLLRLAAQVSPPPTSR
jgi:hypothetical protein